MVPMGALLLAIAAIAPPMPPPGAPAAGAQAPPTAPESFGRFAIILYVEDIERSVRFYRDSLGFKLNFYLVGSAREVPVLTSADGQPYAASVSAGNQEISLQRSSGEARLPATGARYHFEVPNPAGYYDRLVAHGLAVHHLVKTTSGSPYLFSVNDPDGHWLFFKGQLPR